MQAAFLSVPVAEKKAGLIFLFIIGVIRDDFHCFLVTRREDSVTGVRGKTVAKATCLRFARQNGRPRRPAALRIPSNYAKIKGTVKVPFIFGDA